MANFEDGAVYDCKVLDQGFGKSKNKGTQFFYLTVQPVARVLSDTEVEPEFTQFTRTIERYMTDKTIDYLLEDLESLGWAGGSLSELAQNKCFVGTTIRCACKHESGQDGKVYDKFSIYREFAGKKVEPLEATDVRRLDSLFGSKVKAKFGAARPAAKSAPSPATQTVPPEDGGGSDLPF